MRTEITATFSLKTMQHFAPSPAMHTHKAERAAGPEPVDGIKRACI